MGLRENFLLGAAMFGAVEATDAEAKTPPPKNIDTQCRIEQVSPTDKRIRVTDEKGRALVSNKLASSEYRVESGDSGRVDAICVGERGRAFAAIAGRESVVRKDGQDGRPIHHGNADVVEMEKWQVESGAIVRFQAGMSVLMVNATQLNLEKRITAAAGGKNMKELGRLKTELEQLAIHPVIETVIVSYSVNGVIKEVTYLVSQKREKLQQLLQYICDILARRQAKAPEPSIPKDTSGLRVIAGVDAMWGGQVSPETVLIIPKDEEGGPQKSGTVKLFGITLNGYVGFEKDGFNIGPVLGTAVGNRAVGDHGIPNTYLDVDIGARVEFGSETVTGFVEATGGPEIRFGNYHVQKDDGGDREVTSGIMTPVWKQRAGVAIAVSKAMRVKVFVAVQQTKAGSREDEDGIDVFAGGGIGLDLILKK